MTKTKKEKKRLVMISALIILLVVSLVNSISKDWTTIMKNKSKAEELSLEYKNLLKAEEKLINDVTKLQDDEYLAQYAKEKYMYSEEGETILRLD